jgi:uncharacterized membrane protein YfcA
MTSRGAFVLGTAAGSLGSLVGMGGSFFALPVLMSKSIGIASSHQAVGTSMFTVVGTALGGTVAYLVRDGFENDKTNTFNLHNLTESKRIGDVDVFAAIFLSFSSAVTVSAGARLTKHLTQRSLRFLVAGCLLGMAPLVPLRESIRSYRGAKTTVSGEDRNQSRSSIVRPLLIGAGSGLLAGLLGVGGGAVAVPLLSLFTDLPYQVALGTSLTGNGFPKQVFWCLFCNSFLFFLLSTFPSP